MNSPLFFPEQAYPQLFEDVMMLRIFPDSKTFADAVPLAPIDEINLKYNKIHREDRSQVNEFVKQWFELPKSNPNAPVIESLPINRHISSLWDHLLRRPDQSGQVSSLIPLPHSYIVPGGRFREIYYWDSYFTMLGLKVDARHDVISDMIKNFSWLIAQFGHIPNGNRSYFLSRSQPPFFALMIELLAEIKGLEVYTQYLQDLLREYAFWMDDTEAEGMELRRIVKLGEHQYLNRYYDDSNSPRSESYFEDRILFEAEPDKNKKIYRDLRAACESGWDFSSRWLEDGNHLRSIRTTNMIPVDLNSLLYLMEKTIAKSFEVEGDQTQSADFLKKAQDRAILMNKWLWNNEAGIFTDYDFAGKKFGTPSLAMVFPLFANISSQLQAERSIQFLSQNFLRPGGWVTTSQNTGQQWDAPNGWAPLQWITYVALKNYGASNLANEGANNWLKLNEDVFKRTGRMMEKYNVEDLTLDAGGGEYPVQDGFGWTNGVYLSLSKKIRE